MKKGPYWARCTSAEPEPQLEPMKILGAHIDARRIDNFPGHFAKSDQRPNPQVCIIASGWKARILAFIFRAK